MRSEILFVFIGLITFSHERNLNTYNSTSRIVNGEDVAIGEIPFQVSLQYFNYHFCGGSIINENYIVTASHCVDRKTKEMVKVVVGTVDIKNPYAVHQASNIIMHKEYNPFFSYKNDIALIKVKTPFAFSKLVQPVALPELHAIILTNASAIVSGWGDYFGGHIKPKNILQKAQIRIASQDYCRSIMKEKSYDIHPTQICANDPSMRRGQCNGDSGGPLIVNGKLTGIVSWSVKDPYCASTKYPGVYTRVPEFVDWILEHAV